MGSSAIFKPDKLSKGKREKLTILVFLGIAITARLVTIGELLERGLEKYSKMEGNNAQFIGSRARAFFEGLERNWQQEEKALTIELRGAATELERVMEEVGRERKTRSMLPFLWDNHRRRYPPASEGPEESTRSRGRAQSRGRRCKPVP